MTPDPALTGDLPVRDALPALAEALDGDGAAVLVAPPGSGKTTLVPLWLADRLDGRVIVAEPRRVAVRAAARRMAHLTGTPVGDLVGYRHRGETRAGPRTRVEVVTTGVLVRMLQRDPELPGVAAVVIDECHERHLDTDLAIAFTADVRANLRPELRLLATSATAQAERLATVLGGAPIVTAHVAPHPLTLKWRPPGRVLDAPHGLRVDPRFLDHVATVVRDAWDEETGSILVFLPGAGEIEAVRRRLPGIPAAILHGGRSDQDEALRPSARRVVLASAVAESSLTVPGVSVVVDAGLARVPRVDHARGLGSLATVRVSQAAADQRAGRAGREGPGTAYRCWDEGERLAAFPEPEIAVADLTAFALELACWGEPTGAGLALPDPPPAAALDVATGVLSALGAVDGDRVTPRGRAIAAVGAHPRLARALLDGAPHVGGERAAGIVAVLSGDHRGSDDLAALWRSVRTDPAWRAESRRLRAAVSDHPRGPLSDDLAAGLVTGLAYPERIARARGGAYLMTGGTAAELAPGTALTGAAWLAVADAARQPGHRNARVRLAAVIDEATAREAHGPPVTTSAVTWDGDVTARETTRLGAIVLSEKPLRNPDPALVAAALAEGLAKEGLGLLGWDADSRGVRDRLAFLHAVLGEPWPDVSDAALLARAAEWLGPELARARRRGDLAAVRPGQALRRLPPWPEAGRFEELAPERIEVPTGSRIRLDYTDPGAPVLAVKVQEVFGWTATPRVAGGRVPVVLHLLSPAGRPAAVTGDLASFWGEGYRQVRAQLRGRYPRHPWPEDPANAEPTRRAKPRGT
ncbi:ATP-dependent helicase [Actinorhabdospora filicis]|uniref:ATP-dependent helicase n=1 Tax=Actinorhabdospora filicis TaxID=1785913 RepID=A0A9W6SME2_9ACTN|nr:ATP-dependent helicase HrpB [Actinorhabdospora filicis]GLZ78570.1 ATP-dependent helicase [Actinorhabdospora filicis]